MARTTRERIVSESLRLFAGRGYAATSVAEIEAASGLSPGAGGLYRHFPSKQEVLAAAIREHVAHTREQIDFVMDTASSMADKPLAERLAMVCRLGLAKMNEEQELVRVLFRDLDQFPALVQEMRDGLVDPLFQTTSRWLAAQPELRDSDEDWAGLAAVLGGAVVNYWLNTVTLHSPPCDVDQERFVGAWVQLAHGLAGGSPQPQL